jgi:hypothetical protein
MLNECLLLIILNLYIHNLYIFIVVDVFGEQQ